MWYAAGIMVALAVSNGTDGKSHDNSSWRRRVHYQSAMYCFRAEFENCPLPLAPPSQVLFKTLNMTTGFSTQQKEHTTNP